MNTHKAFFKGVAGVGLIALAAMAVAQWAHPGPAFSALSLALIVGFVVANCAPGQRWVDGAGAGIQFSRQALLRAGIVLYGLRLTLTQLAGVGMLAVLTDFFVLVCTFSLAWFLGRRVFRLDRETTLLVGAGSSICGAAAVLATGPVVRADAGRQAVAVATVVIFGTLAMFLYPALFGWIQAAGYHPNPTLFGIYTGATLHEVAHVVAAGKMMGDGVADAALMTKMIRVMMLAPFLMVLAFLLARNEAGNGQARGKVTVPWFAFGFVGLVVVNSYCPMPAALHQALLALDTLLLTMAMAALGLGTHAGALRRAGLKPIGLAASLFAFLLVGGFAIQQGVIWLLR